MKSQVRGHLRRALAAGIALLVGVCGGGDAGERVGRDGAWRTLPRAPDAGRASFQELRAVGLPSQVVFVAGASYDRNTMSGLAWAPERRRWQRLPDSPLRQRAGYTAVGARSRVLVWGGALGPAAVGSTAQGAEYRPGSNRWRLVPDAPLSDRSGHVAAWTGEEMIVWGGARSRVGAAYDPVEATWRRIRAAPIRPRVNAAAVWTGERMIVWGGQAISNSGDEGASLSDGATYSPRS